MNKQIRTAALGSFLMVVLLVAFVHPVRVGANGNGGDGEPELPPLTSFSLRLNVSPAGSGYKAGVWQCVKLYSHISSDFSDYWVYRGMRCLFKGSTDSSRGFSNLLAGAFMYDEEEYEWYEVSYWAIFLVKLDVNSRRDFNRWSDPFGTKLPLFITEGKKRLSITAYFLSDYTLRISVEPSGSGRTHSLGEGVHKLRKGTYVILIASHNAGYEFDHWTFDGRYAGRSMTLRFTMNADHEVVAHFKPVTRDLGPSLPIYPEKRLPPDGCRLPAGFPAGMSYNGNWADLQYNEDLLGGMSGFSATSHENLVVIGRQDVNPDPLKLWGVTYGSDTLEVDDVTYVRSKGEDYGLITFDCRNMVTRVSGIGLEGTRAALMWLMNRGSIEGNGKQLVVVKWTDANLDGMVQGKEISVVHERP